MKVRFLNLSVPEKERAALLKAAEKMLIHGQILNGPEQIEFEKRIAKETDRKYAVGVNSGTNALLLAIKALGIGTGDEVITTSLSWVATANAIALNGATPVFADIRDDLNVCPESIKRLITDKTKAIVVVHYTGKIADMDAICKIAKDNNLLVIEDTAQAFSAKYNGKVAGSFGDIASFSFNPMKVLAGCGEAGAVATDSEATMQTLETLRYGGTINREECVVPSINARMDTIQAAFLSVRLDLLDELIKKRRRHVDIYNKMISNVVKTPVEQPDCYDVYYTYTIQTERRDELMEHLESKGIETKIQHKILMPNQGIYKDCVAEKENAEKIAKKILCLPVHEKLEDKDIEYVAETIIDFLK
jgi:dTDP-4-amino-4,6-dideoxygalactose transaminase